MAIEPVKIPQNVYVEDRIIGPVTLKQLAIVGIGTGISYAMFSTASHSGPISIPLGVVLWTPAMVAAAFAFLRINDLTLFNIILLMIERSNKPNMRYWSAHPGISINFVSKAAKQAVIDANTKIAENANKLAELTRQMEKREEELTKLATHELAPVQTAQPARPQPGNRRLDGIGVLTAPIPGQPVAAQSPAPENAAVQAPAAAADGKSVDGISAGGTPDKPASPLDAFKHVFPTN